MTKKEFALIADAIRTYYPKEKIFPNEQSMALWYEQLKDLDYKLTMQAVNTWVATNKWSPSIADIRATVVDMIDPTKKTWGEAWAEAVRAITHFGYYQEKEALESFDELTRTCVKRIGFKEMCKSEDLKTERANFRMIFEQEQEQRKLQAQTPQGFKLLMDKVKQIESK